MAKRNYNITLYYDANQILIVNTELRFAVSIIQAIIPYLNTYSLDGEPYTLEVTDKWLGEYMDVEIQKYYKL